MMPPLNSWLIQNTSWKPMFCSVNISFESFRNPKLRIQIRILLPKSTSYISLADAFSQLSDYCIDYATEKLGKTTGQSINGLGKPTLKLLKFFQRIKMLICVKFNWQPPRRSPRLKSAGGTLYSEKEMYAYYTHLRNRGIYF